MTLTAPVEAQRILRSPHPARRYVDWIWRVRGQVELPDGQTGGAAIDQLVPLLQTAGTSYERTSDALWFTKKDPIAHDRLAVFDAGVVRIVDEPASRMLRYDFTSRILLACFLAPFLFLGFAQIAIEADTYHKAEKAAKKLEPKKKKNHVELEFPRHAIDEMLAAPPTKTRKQIDADDLAEEKERIPALPAYIFAVIFSLLYLFGRLFEHRAIKNILRHRLQ